MAVISLIAAVDQQFGLGKNNQLLCHLPADLKYFKAVTLGKPLIMGRKTFESIGKALPGRRNIVLSQTQHVMDEVEFMSSLQTALEQTADDEEIMIIGGATLYSQSLLLADRIYLSRIDHSFDADVFFPSIDEHQWDCVEEQFRPSDETNRYNITFCRYERRL